jgi:hypothetical protein
VGKLYSFNSGISDPFFILQPLKYIAKESRDCSHKLISESQASLKEIFKWHPSAAQLEVLLIL